MRVDILIGSDTASSDSKVSRDVTGQRMDFSTSFPGRFCAVHTKAWSSLLWGTHGNVNESCIGYATYTYPDTHASPLPR